MQEVESPQSDGQKGLLAPQSDAHRGGAFRDFQTNLELWSRKIFYTRAADAFRSRDNAKLVQYDFSFFPLLKHLLKDK